jgi:HK97 gp10 family phage protein
MSFISHKDEILKELEAKTAQALEICGGMAESYAKEACPVDTGRLRNSITHAQTGEREETIGSGVEYAPFVELGTTRMSARPFLGPAAEGHADQYSAVIKQVLSS